MQRLCMPFMTALAMATPAWDQALFDARYEDVPSAAERE